MLSTSSIYDRIICEVTNTINFEYIDKLCKMINKLIMFIYGKSDTYTFMFDNGNEDFENNIDESEPIPGRQKLIRDFCVLDHLIDICY